MSKTLLVIGNVNVDLVMGPHQPWPRPGTEVILPDSEFRVGGAAGNAALALDALEMDYRLIANRGDDILGRWLAEPFQARATSWTVDAASTTVSVGISHPDGERTFFTTTGHLHKFRLSDVLAQIGSDSTGGLALLMGIFVTPALIPDYNILIATLRKRGHTIALDTGWPDGGWTPKIRETVLNWSRSCDHLLLNRLEVMELTEAATLDEAVHSLLTIMPEGAALVVKEGAEGARGWQGGEAVYVPAPRVDVVDTIGAGDTFAAAYVASVMRGSGLKEAVESGVAAASLAVSTSPRRYK